jgi:hypothetical protein
MCSASELTTTPANASTAIRYFMPPSYVAAGCPMSDSLTV